MKKVLKASILAIFLAVGFILINTPLTRALTVASSGDTPSACPDKYPNNTKTCTVRITSITVNGFTDWDTSATARTTPVPYGYLIPGQTITISWQDNTNGQVDFFDGTPIENYLIKYGCGNTIDLSNDNYIIGTTKGIKHISWTVPSEISNYQYCKIWVYAKGIPQSYQPTLGVSNTRAFTIQQPVTRYACNTATWQCYESSTGPHISLSDCQANCVAPTPCVINSFSAPSSVSYNGNAALNWSTFNCNSCTASANPANSYWSGSQSLSGNKTIYNLTKSTNFTLSCSGVYGSDTKSVLVSVYQPTLNVSCSATPNPIQINQTVTFTANVSGGVSPYAYAWSGAVTGISSSVSKSFSSAGTYTANLTVTDSGSQTKSTSCNVNVQAPPPDTRYTCNTNYQCVVASNGEYTSLANCQSNCVPPVRYSCNTNTYQCYQATNGTYGTYNDCASACQPPLTRYTCNTTTWQCYVSTSGQYTSWQTCYDACHSPQICTPYQTRACTTAESCPGTQTCNYNGTVWGSCLDTPNDNCPVITQSLSVSCYASPNPSQVNQTVTFYSNVSGGSGSYTYSWSNYASGNNSYYQTTFGYAGTYTAYLTVHDSYGRNGNTACSATVYGQSITTPTLSFWADDYTLTKGESTYLRWTSSNTNYCVASNGWSGTKSTSSYEATAPPNQTTYTLTCYGSGGQVNQSLTIYASFPTTTLSFTKLGRNLSYGDRVYSKVIRVVQGDVIEFYLTVTAGSSNDLTNVIIKDNLPSVFSYQSGTTKVNGITQTDGITTGGLSLGTIPKGTSKTITFQALSTNPGTYLTYTNIAEVTASGVSAVSDSATINYGAVLGAATVETGIENSLLISLLLSIGLTGLLWYYLKFNIKGKLVLATIENKIREYRINKIRKSILKNGK